MNELDFGDIIGGMFGALAVSGAVLALGVIICIVMIVAECKLFTKAGYEWWEAIIPIYNGYVLYKIIYGEGKGWKFFLTFIPVVGQFIAVVAMFRLAQQFGGSLLLCILSVLFSPIVLLILTFGSADYHGSYDGLL